MLANARLCLPVRHGPVNARAIVLALADPHDYKDQAVMLRIVEYQRHFASRPPGGGDSREADTMRPRQPQNGKGEQSSDQSQLGNRLALFTWQGVWRASFDRAFLAARSQCRWDMRPLASSLTPCLRHLTHRELKCHYD